MSQYRSEFAVARRHSQSQPWMFERMPSSSAAEAKIEDCLINYGYDDTTIALASRSVSDWSVDS